MSTCIRKNRGFLLIELLLTLGFMAILFGASFMIYEQVPYQNDLAVTTLSSRALLERAKQYAGAVAHDTEWGVRFEENQAILFKGTSFALRDVAYDETITLLVEVSGDMEYVFHKIRSRPQEIGTTVFTSPVTGQVQTITINTYGLIESN